MATTKDGYPDTRLLLLRQAVNRRATRHIETALEIAMPSIDDFNTSQYLKKEDVERPLVATITGTELQDFDGQRKLVVSFAGDIKPLVASAKVNREAIADVAGTKDYTAWPGTKIELFKDGNVYDLSGRRVGGIRIRPPAAVAPAVEAPEDDVEW